MRVRIRLLLTLPLLIFGLCATAQTTTIPVQAGEHAQFTRLVIQIPEANSWRVTTDAMTARVEVDGPPLQFDLSQTFAKIPRTRLRNATATPGRLELDLACVCEIRASEDIPQYLVIDILGTPSPRAKAASRAIRPPERPDHIERARSPDTARAGAVLARAMRGHAPAEPSLTSFTLHQFSGSTIPPTRRTEPSDHQADGTPVPSRIEIAQELGRVVAGSVAQGLLDPVRRLDADKTVARSDDETARPNEPALAVHLRLPFHENTTDQSHAGKDTICHDLALLDLKDWTPGMQVERTPQALHLVYGEFDKVDHEQGLNLIRYFLSVGFGAEARLAATLLDLPRSLANLITGITHALDQERMPEGIDLSGLKDCSPFGSLWAFLGADARHTTTDFPYDFLVQAVEALPPHLRLHLGPEILQRLSAQDQAKPAMMIEAALDRVAVQPTAEFQLAKVALALAETPSDRAAELENTLSPQVSDDALVFLFARRDDQKEDVEPDLIEIAYSRLLALRGDARGRELTRLLVRALARGGSYTEAFARAQAWDTGLAENEVLELRLDLLDHLTDMADDAEFLGRIFEQRPWEIDAIAAQSAQRIAARLSELGFEQQARLTRLPKAAHSTTETAASPTASAVESDLEDGAFATGPSALSDQMASGSHDFGRARLAQGAAQNRLLAGSGNAQTDMLESASGNIDDAVEPGRERDPTDTEPAGITDARAEQLRTGSNAEREYLTNGAGLLTMSHDALERSAELRARLGEMLNGLE